MARRALGRGLGALIPNADKLLQSEVGEEGKAAESGEMSSAETSDAATANNQNMNDGSGAVDAVGGAEGSEQRSEQDATSTGSMTAVMEEREDAAERPEGTRGDHEVTAAPTESIATATPEAPARTIITPPATDERGRRALASGRASAVIEVALDRIAANPYQPRTRFNDDELQELVNSIISKGVLQPVLVRRRGVGYELIAGERRLRAARRAGLNTIPAIVRDAQDDDMLEIAIIENQQRVDLNPVEAAEAYSRAVEEFGLSVEELAMVVGKDRSTVANLLRLLGLPKEVQGLLREGKLEMGHGRALAGIKSPTRAVALGRRAARFGMSVRAVEKLARETEPKASRLRRVDPELVRFEDRLRQRFATQVRITRRGHRGKLEIEFYNQEDLERILDELNVLSQG